MNTTLTIIEMTPIDAELFIKFREFQDQFTKLLVAGVFDAYLGHMDVCKDGTNAIRQVENHTVRKF